MILIYSLILCLSLTACGSPVSQQDLRDFPKEEELVEELVLDPIEERIENMDLREKVGQVIMTKASIDLEDLSAYPFGGFLFFKDDFRGLDGSRARVAELKRSSPQAFIAVDEEGGLVERFPEEYKSFPPARDLAGVRSEEFFYDYGRLLGKKLNSLNFNINFAPVLDVDSNPKNPVIASRAFSDQPDQVAKAAVNVARGMESRGVVAVGKHFPGHGDTDIDSHMDLPRLDKSLEELNQLELVPFKAFIDSGGQAIMVGHILYSQLDDRASSLSKNVIDGLLRGKLGFEGLVFSDDMIMEAVVKDRTIEEASSLFLEAGGDVLVISDPARAKLVFDYIYSQLEEGDFSEEDLDLKLYRILSLKAGFLDGEEFEAERINEELDQLLDREGLN